MLDLLHDDFAVLSLHQEPLVSLATIQQVHILQSTARCDVFLLDFAVDHTTLQIEDVIDQLAALSRVGHKQDVNWGETFHPHRKNTIDPGHQRIRVFL